MATSSGDDDSLYASLMPQVVVNPVISGLEEKTSMPSAETLRSGLMKAERLSPGITFELFTMILDRAELQIDLNEALLRIQAASIDPAFRINRSEPEFVDVEQKAIALRKILGRIPDEIQNRKAFLSTIKEIASAIKNLLDAVGVVMDMYQPGPERTQLDAKKREFVKYSKRFSTTLKNFFKDEPKTSVFRSANYLVHQTNIILRTLQMAP